MPNANVLKPAERFSNDSWPGRVCTAACAEMGTAVTIEILNATQIMASPSGSDQSRKTLSTISEHNLREDAHRILL